METASRSSSTSILSGPARSHSERRGTTAAACAGTQAGSIDPGSQDSRYLNFEDEDEDADGHYDEDDAMDGPDDGVTPSTRLSQPSASSSSTPRLPKDAVTQATSVSTGLTRPLAAGVARQRVAKGDVELCRDEQDDEDADGDAAGDMDDDDEADNTPLAVQAPTVPQVLLPKTFELQGEERIKAGLSLAPAVPPALEGLPTAESADEGEVELLVRYDDDEDDGQDVDDGNDGDDQAEDEDASDADDEDPYDITYTEDPFLREVENLYQAVPMLRRRYDILDKLGEGTFSTVYKAQPMYSPPQPQARTGQGMAAGRSASVPVTSAGAGLASKGNAFAALKRIYVSSSPARIVNELDILLELRNHDHISHLIEVFRDKDQVIAVMSFSDHVDFRDYFRIIPMTDIRCYFRCLFSALAAVHKAGVIHRDVKPANFLYNPLTGHGTLCDFGLAERFVPSEWRGRCHHTLPTDKHPHGQAVLNRDVPSTVLGEMEDSAGKGGGGGAVGDDTLGDAHPFSRATHTHQHERVGYLREDARPPVRANRAGTRGFRAPEVLLKCQDQTVALDVWSAGVILLCMLTKRFPLFNADDDIVALLELGVLFGKRKMESCAMFHNRTFKTDIPDITADGIRLQDFIRRMNPDPLVEIDELSASLHGEDRAGSSSSQRAPLGESSAPSQRFSKLKDAQGTSQGGSKPTAQRSNLSGDVDERVRRLSRLKNDWTGAFELVKTCLQPICTKRWSAERILREHRFFNPSVATTTSGASGSTSKAGAEKAGGGGPGLKRIAAEEEKNAEQDENGGVRAHTVRSTAATAVGPATKKTKRVLI